MRDIIESSAPPGGSGESEGGLKVEAMSTDEVDYMAEYDMELRLWSQEKIRLRTGET